MKLPKIKIDVLNDSYDMVKRDCELKLNENGEIQCTDIDAIDYYGEFRGGTPYIAPSLIRWAESRKGYWEWENPECIVFVK